MTGCNLGLYKLWAGLIQKPASTDFGDYRLNWEDGAVDKITRIKSIYHSGNTTRYGIRHQFCGSFGPQGSPSP